MDKPKKPQTSDEEDVPAPPAPILPPALPAGSPFRPVSHRRRQAKLPEAPAAVERPSTNIVFEASPTTIASALAKAGPASDESSPVFRFGGWLRVDSEVEIHLHDDDGEDGAASPR